jgi:dGTPase
MTASFAGSMVGYQAQDRARRAPEPPKRRDRTAFERDRARVLHSAALRRLAAKTQVADPGTKAPADESGSVYTVRTRLTHSLEVAQIARELGKSLGCDPDLVELAGLAHDIGHPPFGHNGELALDTVAKACGGFEGNAQSLRILTRLEPKSFAEDGSSVGLNLTRAALDATMKYPWTSSENPHKYGIYPDDVPAAVWIREYSPGMRLCIEAQVMDWSDDIAYSVHDLEDALVAGHIHLGMFEDPSERMAVCEVAAKLYCDASPAELDERFVELLAEPFWPERFDGTARTYAALKNLTSTLIGRFCLAAETATREAYGTSPLTRYAADLVVPRKQRLECALLKSITAHYVWISHDAARARQRELITELGAALVERAPGALDPVFRELYLQAPDDTTRLRVVVDQIASLTDQSAVAWHHKLTSR